MLGILFASDVVYLLLPDKYYGSTPYVGPVLLGYFLSGLYYFAISPAYFYKKTRIIPLPTALIAVVNVILNLIVIPRYGGIGSAWATTATYALLMLVALFIGQHYQRVPYPFARYALVLVLLLGAIFFAAALTPLAWGGLLAKFAALLAFAAATGGLLLVPALRKPPAAA
jgi:O-antigen/teichoic acid export membrane protein